MESQYQEIPKVFISYSHDSSEHKEWVLKLATDMVSHGIEVILDQWGLKIGKDLRFFMEDGLSDTKFVICVCSEAYVKKANQGQGGVGYETTIISSDLLINTKTEYILPVVKNNNTDNKVPKFLLNKLFLDFDNGDYFSNYYNLIKKIHNVNMDKPKLGENPFKSGFIPNISEEIDIITEIEINKYKSIELEGIAEFDYSKNNGIYTIGTGITEFKTKWSSCSSDCIYAYNDYVDKVGYKDNETEMPIYEDLKNFDYTSRSARVNTNEVVIFKNKNGNFLVVKVLVIINKNRNGHNNYLKFKYKVLYN